MIGKEKLLLPENVWQQELFQRNEFGIRIVGNCLDDGGCTFGRIAGFEDS